MSTTQQAEQVASDYATIPSFQHPVTCEYFHELHGKKYCLKCIKKKLQYGFE